MEVLDIILPCVYIVVGAALIWFIIELVLTIRDVRKKSTEVIDQLQPTIKEVQGMVTDIQPTIKQVQGMITDVQPVVKKVDPIMDRVTLTIDAANLEILRVDEILEDVGQITNTVTNTMDTVNNVTSAPMDMITSMTKKVREKMRPKFASDESVQAGLESGEGNSQQPTNPIVDFADAAVDAAGAAYKETREKSEARREKQAAAKDKQEARTEAMSDKSDALADSVLGQIGKDTE